MAEDQERRRLDCRMWEYILEINDLEKTWEGTVDNQVDVSSQQDVVAKNNYQPWLQEQATMK